MARNSNYQDKPFHIRGDKTLINARQNVKARKNRNVKINKNRFSKKKRSTQPSLKLIKKSL